jgi:ribosome-binding protein aMBF1 (putative translation factor)
MPSSDKTQVHTVFDWASAPPPWNTLGPEIAASVRRAIEREPSRLVRWARALREEREGRGMSQLAVACHTGISTSVISKIELAQPSRDSPAWDRLAAFYEITLE